MAGDKNSTKTPILSVIIPAHDEAAGIANVLTVVRGILEPSAPDWEIIVVDDGSTDDTFAVVKDAATREPRIKGVRFSRNFGKEAALLCGLSTASGQVVVTLDADLQHPPTLIPKMIEQWKAGARVVHAVKRGREHDSILARFRAHLFNSTLSKFAKIDLNNSSDFKLLDRIVVDNLVHDISETRRFYRGLAGWVGYPSASIVFDVDARQDGQGKWSGLRLWDLAITAIVSFTSAPLRVVTFLGLLTLVLGLLIGTDAVISWIRGNAISGFATIIITLLIVGSFIMISLGIIGEYIAKMYDEVKRRPPYLVQSMFGLDHKLVQHSLDPQK